MKRDYSVAITVTFPGCFTRKPGVTDEQLAGRLRDEGIGGDPEPDPAHPTRDERDVAGERVGHRSILRRTDRETQL